jgi:Ca2+-binding EF-hand superfamily protein
VTNEKPLCSDNDEINFKKPGGDKIGLGPDYNVFNGPTPKKNMYMKETQKLDQIMYFFDYLDDVFQADITKEFSQLLQAAKTVPEEDPKVFDDPYTPKKLLYYFSGGLEGKNPSSNIDIYHLKIEPEQIKKYKHDFNVEEWKESFSAAKISNIIKSFGWGNIPNISQYFKRLIDKFDFRGTGRLNAKEFLFYAIWENYKSYSQCKQFCFKKIIEEKIDPLFSFFDCNSDGYINSENIWNGLKYLKRSDANKDKYDLYKCELPKTYNKYFRTNAINDFILKNFNVAEGYLTREEFRKGILLGFWERQVNRLSVAFDDSINRKGDRWDTSGIRDKDCDELLQMFQLKK